MKKQLLSGALAAIALGLSAVSIAQMGPGPIDAAANARPQCAGIGRDACLRQPITQIPSLSGNAGRVGYSTAPSGGAAGGIGGTSGIGGGSTVSGGGSAPRQ